MDMHDNDSHQRSLQRSDRPHDSADIHRNGRRLSECSSDNESTSILYLKVPNKPLRKQPIIATAAIATEATPAYNKLMGDNQSTAAMTGDPSTCLGVKTELSTIHSEEERLSSESDRSSVSAKSALDCHRPSSLSSSLSAPELPEAHQPKASTVANPQMHSPTRPAQARATVPPLKPASIPSSGLPSPQVSPAGTDSKAGSTTPIRPFRSNENVRRLSAADLHQLASHPASLPVAIMPPKASSKRLSPANLQIIRQAMLSPAPVTAPLISTAERGSLGETRRFYSQSDVPGRYVRTLSSPPTNRRTQSPSPRRHSFHPQSLALNLPHPHTNNEKIEAPATGTSSTSRIRTAVINPTAYVIPSSSTKSTEEESEDIELPVLPLPPMSFFTHLQLELTSSRPSPLYIHRPDNIDSPYESSAVKFNRLKNMLLLPPYLERTLTFGVLACLDAWLYTFTILPIRFVMALSLLTQWWAYVLAKECRCLVGFVWFGLGRLWGRLGRSKGTADVTPLAGSAPKGQPRSRRSTGTSVTDLNLSTQALGQQVQAIHDQSASVSASNQGTTSAPAPITPRSSIQSNLLKRISHLDKHRTSSHAHSHLPPVCRPLSSIFRHRRTKSVPSELSSFHKADLLQGAIILFSCIAMMKMDASRMYHFIRGQSDIKLYVIFNILEVADRLMSSIGQDILECLFSTETLSRNSQGRSKVLMPLVMFLLALVYTVAHASTLYFHAITLNVAVNSYSNALLTLLMSNQFVEVKSTVFKRFERDNLFQLTCADVVERFQLWVMLVVIGLRNVIEMGGLSAAGAGYEEASSPMPMHSPSILPHSFTVLPSWLLSGEVLSPFVIVISSEIFVDVVKHAYVNRFNSIKPTFYSRILDILCKDYYTDAFVTPSLTRRLGLAVIPLSCLFIRASFQTYHMFLSTHLAPPLPSSTQTSLSQESATPSPAIIEALNKFDTLIRDSLGRSVHGSFFTTAGEQESARRWFEWTSDDIIALLTMLLVFFIIFLVALIVKLLLGMLLLRYSSNRYAKMMLREELAATGYGEKENHDAKSKRLGGYGHIELGDERTKWINADQSEGLKKSKEKKWDKAEDYAGISRYEMVAKRIW
ncbi:hypothetical protein Cpir12675_005419 [Ceratocystis pirilliformis]|uniref:Endoplasmic reticulum membrane protein 65 n=1 Tax=Ceratocystis pirilliformis TaxID=259994 RepID=A0ABR3YSR1_9PEZI